MEHGAINKPQRAFEILKLMEEEDDPLGAALGYQALAMRANNPSLATSYFEASLQALEHAETEAPHDGPVPYAQTVWSRALLNLAPVTRELVVDKAISEPEVVGTAFAHFIYDLGKHARAAKKLVSGPDVDQEASIALHRGQLISAFTTLAVWGLLMRFQTDMLQSSDWLAHSAFLEPEILTDENPLMQRYDLNIFNGTKTNFELVRKIYVRSSRGSFHRLFKDGETAIVWVDNDLALPSDQLPGIELAIINDLQSTTNRGRERVHARIDNLLTSIDERTLNSVRGRIRRF
jgi:hypothetical protein